jgi:hypothetical protein
VSEKTLRGFVDRIEDDRATILLGESGDQVTLPIDCLPDGAGEGSVLRVVIRFDDEATRHTEDIVDSLISRLESGQ